VGTVLILDVFSITILDDPEARHRGCAHVPFCLALLV
jgi:hypothetical protein